MKKHSISGLLTFLIGAALGVFMIRSGFNGSISFPEFLMKHKNRFL